MKTKIFWAGLVMAAAAMYVSCTDNNTGNNRAEALPTAAEEEAVVIRNDKNLINGDLYRASETRQIYGPAGELCDNVNFGRDHFSQSRVLFVKQSGGFSVGYEVITDGGIVLQSEKSFYFYNRHCLKPIPEVFNISGMILNNGTLIPVKLQVNGADNKFMKDCKDTDIISFVPLRSNEDAIKHSVKEMKDYCNKNGIKAKAVPYLQFSD